MEGKYHHENHNGPFFEEPSNLIDPGKTLVAAVHLFTEAVLNCRVGMLKDKTVSYLNRQRAKLLSNKAFSNKHFYNLQCL